jgi:hypothetical protein
MNPLTAILLGAMLWLSGSASGGMVMLLGRERKNLVVIRFEGTKPHVTDCTYTFIAGKVLVAVDNKQIGQVALTADEQAEVDRYCELMKKQLESIDKGERHRMRLLEELNAVILPFDDFKKRAAKGHQNSVGGADRDDDKPSN